MHKSRIVLIVISMFILTKVAFSQLQLRDGWPVTIDNYSSSGIKRSVKAYELENGQFCISAANAGQIKVLDLDGNLFPGWPVTYSSPADSGYIMNGPFIGDLNGDNVPEITVITAFAGNEYYHRIITYNFDGTPNNLYSSITNLDGSYIAPTSAPTLIDLDQDGDEELLFIRDSLYAINDDGSQFPGFPWAINDTMVTFNAGITVGVGEGWNEEEPIVLWGTRSKVHARQLNSNQELSGWPIELVTDDLYYTPLSLIPRDDGWFAGIVDKDSLYLWNQDGEICDEFPIRNPPVNFCQTSTYDLIVGDINGDSNPDLLFKPYNPRLYAFDLNGDLHDGFPTEIFDRGTTEPAVIMQTSESDSATIIIGGSDEYVVDLCIYKYNQITEDVIHYDVDQSYVHYSNVCLIPPRNGIMQIAFFITTGELYVYDYPAASEVHFEWQMQGNTPGGNRMYHPNNYVGVKEPEKKMSNDDFEVGTIYPNPGNSFFRMKFRLPESGSLPVTITDITGRTVFESKKEGTPNSIVDWQWDTKDNKGNLMASGVYFIQLGDNTTDIRKAVLMR